jgi:hypothetical protein
MWTLDLLLQRRQPPLAIFDLFYFTIRRLGRPSCLKLVEPSLELTSRVAV